MARALPQHLPGNCEFIRQRPRSNRIEMEIGHLDLPAIELDVGERKAVQASLGWSVTFVRERQTRQQGWSATISGLGEEAIGEWLPEPRREKVNLPVRYFLERHDVHVCGKDDADRSLEVGVAYEDVTGGEATQFGGAAGRPCQKDCSADQERA